MLVLKDLESKYNVIFDGYKRLYLIDLEKRIYVKDSTTPVLLKIEYFNIENELIEKEFHYRSWTELIQNLCIYLKDNFKKDINQLLNYRTKWSRKPQFSDFKWVNYKEIGDNLYINCNNTCLHSIWLIQDILKFYNIELNRCKLMCRYAQSGENENLKNIILDDVKNEFLNYLNDEFKGRSKFINLIIVNMDKINEVLKKVSKTQYNFYLFDDYYIYGIYKSKFLKDCLKYINWNENQYKSVKKILNIYSNFFKNYILYYL